MVRYKIIFFLTVILFHIPVFICEAQKISISIRDESLAHVLNTLNEKYLLKFAFDNNLLEKISITKKIKKAYPEDAVRQLLEGTGLAYQIVNSVFIIRPLPGALKKDEMKTNKTKNDSLPAHDYSISGLIKDAQVGEYLPYASILLVGSLKGTASNNDGFFMLTGLKAEPVDLYISYLGYESKVIHINPVSDDSLLIVELDRRTEVIPEAVVRQNLLEIIEEGKESGQLKMNPSRIYSFPSLGEIDIFRALQLLPGIDGSDEPTSGLNIRRSTYDKNLVLYDGFTLYNIDHFFGMFSAFNSKAIKDIQVYKGGFEPKYEGRVSGVVDITGKSGNSKKPSVNIGLNMFSADALLELPLFKNASFVIAVRRSFTDMIHNPFYIDLLENFRYDMNRDNTSLFPSTENELLPDFHFYDLNAKLTIKPTLKDVISVSVYSGSDNLNINKTMISPMSENLIEKSGWGNEGASFRWARKWSKNFYNNIIVGASEYFINNNMNENYLINSGTGIDSLNVYNDQKNILKDYNITFNNQFQFTPSNLIEFGLSCHYININYATQQTLTDNSNIDHTQVPENLLKSAFMCSPYFQNTFSYNKLKALKFGVRYSYYQVTNTFYLEPRASLKYELFDNLFIKAAIGKYYQFVNKIISNEYNSEFSGYWKLSSANALSNKVDNNNPAIIVANHVMAGFNYEYNSNFSVDVEGYRKNMGNVTDLETEYYYDPVFVNQAKNLYFGSTIINGIDFFIKGKINYYQLWAGYTLSKSTNQFNNDTINHGKPFPSLEDQRHEIKLVNLYNYNRWEFSAVWIYGSGRPYDTVHIQQSVLYKNTNRLPAYNRLDVGINYSYDFRTFKTKIGISLFNLFNHQNIRNRLYQITENPDFTKGTDNRLFGITQVDIHSLGFIPNIFINIQF